MPTDPNFFSACDSKLTYIFFLVSLRVSEAPF